MANKKKRGYAKKLEDRRSGRNPRGSKWVETPVTNQAPLSRYGSGMRHYTTTPHVPPPKNGGVTKVKLPHSGREVLARRVNGEWHFL
ncbi:MAG: hypothetical protein HZA80_00985 [Candidatus Taylorbacteria bacterium]|nr:hypothetical protein [Candidatus Taylorbacteria bacterium]